MTRKKKKVNVSAYIFFCIHDVAFYLSLLSATKSAKANLTHCLMKADSETADKKGQRARKQKRI